MMLKNGGRIVENANKKNTAERGIIHQHHQHHQPLQHHSSHYHYFQPSISPLFYREYSSSIIHSLQCYNKQRMSRFFPLSLITPHIHFRIVSQNNGNNNYMQRREESGGRGREVEEVLTEEEREIWKGSEEEIYNHFLLKSQLNLPRPQFILSLLLFSQLSSSTPPSPFSTSSHSSSPTQTKRFTSESEFLSWVRSQKLRLTTRDDESSSPLSSSPPAPIANDNHNHPQYDDTIQAENNNNNEKEKEDLERLREVEEVMNKEEIMGEKLQASKKRKTYECCYWLLQCEEEIINAKYLIGVLLFEGAISMEEFNAIKKVKRPPNAHLSRSLTSIELSFSLPSSSPSDKQNNIEGKKEGFNWLLRSAHLDCDKKLGKASVFALYDLGVLYHTGSSDLDIQKDEVKAKEYFKKAAEEYGDADSMFWLGYLSWPSLPSSLLSNHNFSDQEKEAIDWIRKSAELGQKEGCYFLSFSYFHKLIPDPNPYDKAVYWMKKSSELGHQLASHILGDWLFNGKSSPPHLSRDYPMAVKYYKRSIESSSTASYIPRFSPSYTDILPHLHYSFDQLKQIYDERNQFDNEKLKGKTMCCLGAIYFRGLGVKPDPRYAYSLYQSAARLGSLEGNLNCADILDQGISNSILKSPKMAEQYRSKALEIINEIQLLYPTAQSPSDEVK